jgi:hypothetical protein
LHHCAADLPRTTDDDHAKLWIHKLLTFANDRSRQGHLNRLEERTRLRRVQRV